MIKKKMDGNCAKLFYLIGIKLVQMKDIGNGENLKWFWNFRAKDKVLLVNIKMILKNSFRVESWIFLTCNNTNSEGKYRVGGDTDDFGNKGQSNWYKKNVFSFIWYPNMN